jgi:cytochrome P450
MRRLRRWFIHRRNDFFASATRWALRTPAVMRLIRRRAPGWYPNGMLFGRHLWVTRYEDAVDVLGRQRDFGMSYGARMDQLGTPFILGLDPSRDYDRQRQALVDALETIDRNRLAAETRRQARQLLQRCHGEIDVVAGFADVILAATVGEWMAGGADLAGAFDAARAVARDIFINPFRDDRISARAEAEIPALRALMRDAVTRPGVDGVLASLLQSASAQAGVTAVDRAVDDALGLMVAWLTSVSRTMGYVFDELLRPKRAHELQAAHAAACAGCDEALTPILMEALRYQPGIPALDRVCKRETRVGGRTVRRGQEVVVALTGALRDEHGYPRPEQFRFGGPDRPYLQFGHPKRECLGKSVALCQLVAMSAELLCQRRLRRQADLQLDGPYPAHLRVAFDH